jgi:hypothetical protein
MATTIDARLGPPSKRDLDSNGLGDAVSWHAMQAVARIHALLTLAAPVVAMLVVRGGRPTRSVLGELRTGIDPRAPT